MSDMQTTIPERETIMREVRRAMPDRSFIVARVGLRYIEGDSSAYWTATADLYEPHGTWSGEARWRNEREFDGGGACHAEILRAFPHLAPIVRLHLADVDGLPMHAKTNGWYFYSGQASTYEREAEERGRPTYANREGLSDHARAARALNISPDELPADLGGEEFGAFVDDLAERYERESREAYDLLLSLPV
jgi:hypothetical protein